MGCRPFVRFAGTGPEEGALVEAIARAGLQNQTELLGKLEPEGLADQMNRHRFLLAPTRSQEPIGIVSLEALACGCVPIASSGGGMGESVGIHGFTFDNGDMDGLTRCMLEACTTIGDDKNPFGVGLGEHLGRYRPDAVVRQYGEVIEAAIRDFR